MKKGMTRVTAVDVDSGLTETTEIPSDDFVLITGPDLYLHHAAKHANGTIVVTIKPITDVDSAEPV